MQLTDLQFHNGGYCQQFEYFTGVRSWRSRRFQAVYLTFVHPQHGGCAIDCGYGPAMVEQTRRIPARLFRWTTPIPDDQACMRASYEPAGASRIGQRGSVFLSHFHADHIGGAQQFGGGSFVVRRQAWEQLHQMSPWQQVRHGFLAGLLPSDFDQRVTFIDDDRFSLEGTPLPGFPAIDYWNDGSLWLLDMPGHALGHTGYLLRTTRGNVLYVVDAFWDARTFESAKHLPRVARAIHQHYRQYEETLAKLRSALAGTANIPLACHCPRTQAMVQQSSTER